MKNFRDKSGEFKLSFVKTPLFLWVLLAKIISSFLFASSYLTDLFIKFTNYYVISGFKNPYAFFMNHSVGNEFPYPALMLYIMSIPRALFYSFLSHDYSVVTALHLFVARVPILIADFVLLVVLMRWLKSKPDKVLKYYWCSPILFYINYIHGQLDVIPVTFVIVSLYLLFKAKERWAFIFLGLSICTKTTIVVVLPFYVIYVILKKDSITSIISYFGLLIIAYLVPNLPFINSVDFWNMVFKNKEQMKIFDLHYAYNNFLSVYLLPSAYLVLLLKSTSYKFFNRDLFLMYIGFSFTVLTIFIPPMQGWYYWALPFIIYFYIKQENTPKLSFIFLNVFYFAYFGIIMNSDFVSVFHFLFPQLSTTPVLYVQLQNAGINADFAVNIIFTLLQTSLVINGVWIYKMGVQSNAQYKMKYKPYIMGVGGDSGVGKSTFSSAIQKIFGHDNSVLICGDDMHKWERGDVKWNEYTHLNPKANKLHQEMESILNLKNGVNVHRNYYDHTNGKFSIPTELKSNKLVILEGLHPFYISKMRESFDLKIFIKPVDELRLHWKMVRDMKSRNHTKEQIIESIKKRQSDAEKFILPQEKYANVIVSYDVLKPLSNIGNEDEEISLMLKLKFENEVNVDRLVLALDCIDTLNVDHYYDADHQFLNVFGTIDLEDVQKIGYLLIPEIEDINIGHIEWSCDLDGVIQLFCGYYIFNKLKLHNEYV